MSIENMEALEVSSAAAVLPAVELAVMNPLSAAQQTVHDEDGNASALQLATNRAGVGTPTSAALFQAFAPSADENGIGFVIGNTASTNLRMGFNQAGGYSWIQSHGSKPLRINAIGNSVSIAKPGFNVGICTTAPTHSLHVDGMLRVTNLPVVTTLTGFKQVWVDANGVFHKSP